jgi:hypothetical protein
MLLCERGLRFVVGGLARHPHVLGFPPNLRLRRLCDMWFVLALALLTGCSSQRFSAMAAKQTICRTPQELITASHLESSAQPSEGASVQIAGAVVRPTSLEFCAQEGLSIREAIRRAGDLRWDADRSGILLLRPGPHGLVYSTQLTWKLVSELPANALLLQDRDRLIIHRWPLLELWGWLEPSNGETPL